MVRIIYNHQSKIIVDIVNASEGTTAINDNLYGIIQGKEEEVLIQAIAFGLETLPIFQYIETNNIDIQMEEGEYLIYKNQAFGIRVLNKFIAIRNAQGPTNAVQDLQAMNLEVLGDVRELLYDGSIKSAMSRLNEKSTQIVPQPLKDYFTYMMTEYLTETGQL
jgi:hypothetical protein